MRTNRFIIIAILVTVNVIGATAQPSKTKFQQMLDTYYEAFLKLNPTTASFKGDYRYNDRLENDISAPHRAAAKKLYTQYQDSLKAYTYQKLNAADRLCYDIFKYDLDRYLTEMQFKRYLTPVRQTGDFRLQFSQMGSGSSTHPFNTVKDYEDFLKRVDAFVGIADTAIANMKKGIALKVVQPRTVMVKVVPQLKAIITDDVTASMFYKPVKNMPAAFSAEDKQRLTAAYESAIKEKINPAYQRLLTFIETEYMPQTRDLVGLSALPNGKEEYAFLVKSFTTTNLSPDEVFEIGLKEVARITREMEKIRNEVKFSGTLKEFFAHLQSDPKFFPFKTDDDVTAGYYAIYEKMKPHIAKQFSSIPLTRFEIRPIEKYRAATSAAHYMAGTPDGKRPGVFYFPVIDATKYPFWRMEDLFLHEAIPGHHFQISLQTEKADLPGIQKVGRYGAYVEGWGLYSEHLGKELGLYTDPYQRIGQLQGEMHRAVRLVVDAGMHHKGWTREQAIQYSLDNEPITEANAIQEIERYIAGPGQALSYKIGELKIVELRKKAEKALGKMFDARAFHNEVLKDGAMPLQIFEAKINRWIESQTGVGKKS